MTDLPDFVKQAVNLIGGILTKNHRELLNKFDIPTPIKIAFNVQADGSGNIGGGFAAPNPVTIWQCPVSEEAWLHRVCISSPSGTPKTPLTTGQAALVGDAGTLIYFLPIGGSIAPVVITEGYASAPHLNNGSKLAIYGDSFPANCQLRVDLQISLTSGASQYTPRQHPSKLITIVE